MNTEWKTWNKVSIWYYTLKIGFAPHSGVLSLLDIRFPKYNDQ